MRERFRNYKTGRKMVIAFFSIILLYVVTVTVAIVNVETISRVWRPFTLTSLPMCSHPCG